MYEIDQSIKIEDTSRDTVLAVANEMRYFTILIPRKVKRKLQEIFRKKGKPRLFVYRSFSAGVVLLKDFIKQGSTIVIDQEYYGKERLLRSMIYEMFTRFFDFAPEINFRRIGKHSPAHGIAYGVTKGNREPDRIVRYREIALWAAPKIKSLDA